MGRKCTTGPKGRQRKLFSSLRKLHSEFRRLHGVLRIQPGYSRLRDASSTRSARLARSPLFCLAAARSLAGRPAAADNALPSTTRRSNPSRIFSPTLLGVRQHPVHLRGVGWIHGHQLFESAHAIRPLRSEQMALPGVHPEHFARRSNLEALCRATMRFQFCLLRQVSRSLLTDFWARRVFVRIILTPPRTRAISRCPS